ncbi:MAG: hypothetical protein HY013_14805 [Candidatus Solibacter usitatus]|nr:hypothetical protein [Candidatus Solibacter usitatus]
MIAALFGYRGTHLLWGLRELLKTIDPKLEAQAEEIATRVLTHPLVSDSVFSGFGNSNKYPLLHRLTRRWRLASAIQPAELIRVLVLVAAEPRQTIDAFLNQADPEVQRKARLLAEVLRQVAPAEALKAERFIDHISDATQQAVGSVEAWFHSTMDRVSQRFALWMRGWTVAFAILFAFGAHLDSLFLVKQISSNAEVRAKLVNSADAMLRTASAVAENPDLPKILAGAVAQLKTKEPDATRGIGEPPTFQTRDAAAAWFSGAAKGDAKLVAEFQQILNDSLKTPTSTLQAQANDIKRLLGDSGIQLLPSPYPGIHFNGKREVAGILVTAAFLSLGAPFWFNALKGLSNLRPTLAGRSPQPKAA